jgi:glycosyltransferase involved in cell wall biosynthesis
MTETKVQIIEKVDEPKITILIPTYKKDTYFNRLIQSIQQQKLKNLDIIFVQDISHKTSFPKLEEISKRDKRITIIKNDKGMGLLNSYIKGILNVKTKYMLFLEEEDMLLPYFNEIYTTAETKDKDITDFSYLKGTINGITYEGKINSVQKFQPGISESYYNENFIYDNPLLNKIIKTEIMKNATRTINKKFLEEKFELHVDTLLYICLCMHAKSYESFGHLHGEFHLKKNF